MVYKLNSAKLFVLNYNRVLLCLAKVWKYSKRRYSENMKYKYLWSKFIENPKEFGQLKYYCVYIMY